jgi:hypothetical protein
VIFNNNIISINKNDEGIVMEGKAKEEKGSEDFSGSIPNI